MGFIVHPIRPLTNAVQAVFGRMTDLRCWLPWLVLAVLEAAAWIAIVRFDLVPPAVWAPVFDLWPALEARIHYPEVALALPSLARRMDILLFLTVGTWAQAWTIARFARGWEAPAVRVRFVHRMQLMLIAALLVVCPAVVVWVASQFVDRDLAGLVGAATGIVTATLFFAAPAFVVVHDLDLRRALGASIALLRRLPFAVPLAVIAIAILHAPMLFLRAPAVRAGVAQDPDWILWTFVAHLPVQALGAFIAAGISTYFALRTRERRPQSRARGLHPAIPATAALLALVGCGTGSDSTAAGVSKRFAGERAIERARLRAATLRDSGPAAQDKTRWRAIATQYDAPILELEQARGALVLAPGLDRDLGRLIGRARLGRAEAAARAGDVEAARRDYESVIAQTEFRGLRADAALGLARCEDRGGRFTVAQDAYRLWIEGVARGDWPLHSNGLDVPAYVARRLADRGEQSARAQWIETAQAALAAAAARDERPRDARMVRFTLLLSAARWEDAFNVLRELRAAHDPEGRDGRLLVAEASLLAGGLRRDDAALGVLRGLNAEGSPFDDQHRVAGWLLAGNIHSRRGETSAAGVAFESAAGAARSVAGRSEAALGLARVCAARGDVDEARRYYAHLRQAYPATPAGLLAPLEELRLLRQTGRDADAVELLAEVQRMYRDVIRRYGTEKPALVAARCLGETYGLEGRWQEGIAFLDSMFTTFGTDARAGTLLVLAARVAADQLDDEARAATLLQRVTTRFPDSDVAVLARGFADSLSVRATTVDASRAAH